MAVYENNNNRSKIIFGLAVLICLFWITTSLIKNVYSIALVGAIFEIIWLPAIVLTAVLPIVCVILIVREKSNFKSFNFYSILLIALGLAINLLLRK